MVRAAKEIGRAETMQPDDAERAAGSSGVVLKIMPHVDGTPRIVQLVRFDYADFVCHRAYTGPGALEFHRHTLAPLAERGKRT